MPPERVPKTKEKFGKAERKQLVEKLTDHTRNQGARLVWLSHWPTLEPYIELIGMMGISRGDDTLKPAEQEHLRKMIALQTGFVPKTTRRFAVRDFLQEVYNEVPVEVEAVNNFPEDYRRLPKGWRSALSDLVALQENVHGKVEE